MGFCVGRKWCQSQDCKERCRSWFGSMPDVEYACRNACKQRQDFDRTQFLCGGGYIDQEMVIRNYGYDPCPGGATVQTYIDPLNDRAREDEQNAQLINIAIILAVLLVIGLRIYFMVLKK